MEQMRAWAAQALVWWQSLGYEVHYYAWISVGVIWLCVCLWVLYGLVRRLMGQRKINGTWINSADFEELLDRLQQRERDGVILPLKDAVMLEKYRPDRKLGLKRLGEGDFVSW